LPWTEKKLYFMEDAICVRQKELRIKIRKIIYK
jgi:hypothetical protein